MELLEYLNCICGSHYISVGQYCSWETIPSSGICREKLHIKKDTQCLLYFPREGLYTTPRCKAAVVTEVIITKVTLNQFQCTDIFKNELIIYFSLLLPQLVNCHSVVATSNCSGRGMGGIFWSRERERDAQQYWGVGKLIWEQQSHQWGLWPVLDIIRVQWAGWSGRVVKKRYFLSLSGRGLRELLVV